MWKLTLLIVALVISKSVDAEKEHDLTEKGYNQGTNNEETMNENLSKMGEKINEENKDSSLEALAEDVENKKSSHEDINDENKSADVIEAKNLDAVEDAPIEEKSSALRNNMEDFGAIDKQDSDHITEEKDSDSEAMKADIAENKTEEDHAEASPNHETSYDAELKNAPDIDFHDIPTRRMLTSLDDIIDMKARSGRIDHDDETEKVKSVPVSDTRQLIEPTQSNKHSFQTCSNSCFKLRNEMLPQTHPNPTVRPGVIYNPSKFIQHANHPIVGRHDNFENINMQIVTDNKQNSAEELKLIDEYNFQASANAYPYAHKPKVTSPKISVAKSLADHTDYNNVLAKLTQASEHPVSNANWNTEGNLRRYMNYYASLDPNYGLQNYERFILPRYRRLSLSNAYHVNPRR